jgi:hypothetical protein
MIVMMNEYDDHKAITMCTVHYIKFDDVIMLYFTLCRIDCKSEVLSLISDMMIVKTYIIISCYHIALLFINTAKYCHITRSK